MRKRKSIKPIYLVWAEDDGSWSICTTLKDARTVLKDGDIAAILEIDSICYPKHYLGFKPPKTKITRLSFTTLKG